MSLFSRLLLAVWILNVYDAGITICAVNEFGAVEFNPLMALCLAAGTWVFLLVKIGLVTGVCAAFYRQARRKRKLWGALWVILGFMTVVCLWNTGLVAFLALT